MTIYWFGQHSVALVDPDTLTSRTCALIALLNHPRAFSMAVSARRAHLPQLALDPTLGTSRVLEPGQRKGPNERPKLTPGPEAEVRFIRWLYETYAIGKVTLAELTRRAPTAYAKRWIRRTLHQLLLNPVYAGDIVRLQVGG